MTDDLRIYNISQKIDDALSAVSVNEETGEITGGEEVERLLAESSDKVLSTARYIEMRAALVETLKEKKKSIDLRIKTETRRLDWLKAQTIRAIQALNTVSLEDADTVVKLRRLPASVFVEDETKIPTQYLVLKQETALDKKAILADLKAGKTVDGCSLSQGFTVSIK